MRDEVGREAGGGAGGGGGDVVPVDVGVPGDKSISHRALILAALAEGESRIEGLLDAADTRSTAAALRGLGVAIEEEGDGAVRVRGRGLDGWTRPDAALDCGNSGTTARLLLGALAGCPFEATLTGDASLRSRPMRRVTAPMAAAGAVMEELEAPDRLPIRVRGRRPLSPVAWRSAQASAQVKTALLLAGLTGRAAVEAWEPWRSRDHTERMLRSMGAAVEVEEADDGGSLARLAPPDRLAPLTLAVPGDISSAVYFLALGALHGAVRVRGVGLNPTRTGALGVLARMGGRVAESVTEERGGEPVGDVVASAGPLAATTVAAHEVPALVDEIPLLAAVAALADGATRFDGVGELRVKESDRLRAMSENLRALGVATEEGPEHLVVHGRAGPLRGRVDAHGDHRIAMAFGVLGAVPGNAIEVTGREAVRISFPSFWRTLDRVRGELAAR